MKTGSRPRCLTIAALLTLFYNVFHVPAAIDVIFVKNTMNPRDDNNEAKSDGSEPFSVDIFSERLRFSRPFLIVFFHHLHRWSIYVFIPFSVCLVLAGLAGYVVVNPIKVPLDTANAVNAFAVLFFGVVIPSVLLITWYRSIPWWFLNGTERGWQIFKMIAEENGHRFPDDFWHPFVHNEFGLQEDAFADELVINSETDIEGFIGADVNISYHDKILPSWNRKASESFGVYPESTYWRLEEYGLRFYGERMNIFCPYRAIQSFRKGLLWCNIILKLNQTVTSAPLGRVWTEICISIGHLPTMRGDRMLRDELYQRIVVGKVLNDLIELAVHPGLE
jgi:hypothetical protein